MEILLFTQPNCPKCPKVKQDLFEKFHSMDREINLSEIDVSTDDGMFESIKYNVMKTPAIIVKDSGKQLKLGDVSEIEGI